MTLARRIGWLLATLLVVMATTPAVAGALSLRAPQGEYAGTLRFQVDSMTPALVTATASAVVIRGSMVNTGSEELTGVVARWQRGDAFRSTAAVQSELAEPGQPESLLTGFSPVTDTIAPGATVPFTLRTDAFTGTRGSLRIQTPGVYPIMLNINASFDSGPPAGARVGELHALLTVVSVPGGAPATGGRQSVSVVMPLVDRPHRNPTGAFFDDDLTALIQTGGRLEEVLSAAAAPALPAGAITLAVDPELLEELALMSAGYSVGPNLLDLTRGAAVPSTATEATPAPSELPGTSDGNGTGTAAPAEPGRPVDAPDTAATAAAAVDDAVTTPAVPATPVPTTPVPTAPVPTTPVPTTPVPTAPVPTTPVATSGPTSAAPADSVPTSGATGTQPVPGPSAVPGAGREAATDFLRRLRALAAVIPVLVLPYADIDVMAAVRAGHPEQVTAAVVRGRATARAVLGAPALLLQTVGWPIGGLADPMALSVLRSTGLTSAVLDRGGVVSELAGDRPIISTGSGDVTAVLSSTDLPDTAAGLNRLTGLIAQRWFSSDTATTVLAPARSWQPDRTGYASLTTLLRTLDGAGVIQGERVDDLATHPSGTATLDYPDEAAARELPQSLFGRVRDLTAALTSTQQSFDQGAGDTTPAAPGGLFADILEGFARQPSGGFRSDLGAANRSTAAVQATLDAVHNGVAIVPSASIYTLTSSTSPLLVTIRNDLPYTAHLRIEVDELDALRAGITASDVGIQTIPAFRSVQVPIPSEVTRAGSLTLRVALTTPDGAAWGPQQVLQLRSTAIGSFTVVLIVAAAVIVVLSTAIRIRKRYRQRNERIAAGLQ